jgi:hypothetical protein
MTANHLKFKAEPTPEISYISNIPQSMDNVQHNINVMNQPLSQTFTESNDSLVEKVSKYYLPALPHRTI